jgi:SET domain-containing protein
MPPISGLRVVSSGIHGYGVVACRDFAVGEVIATVDGILRHEDEEAWDDRYALWMDEGYYFDMLDQTRWINHSCDPNGEVEADFDEDGTPWARVVAIKPIRAGEEITYDYAFTAELAEPCACGVQACRRWIVDVDELDRLATLRAAG